MLTSTPTVTKRQLPSLAARIFYDTAMQAAADQKVMMKKAVQIIRSDTASFFDKAKGPSGKKWRPLRHPRPNSAGKDKPLQDIGMMRRAATSDAPGNICRITGNSIIHGVNLVQANLMNYGGIVTPKNGKFLSIPATVEAKRYKSPRNFPRKLRCIINKKGTGGVLVEYVPKNKRRGKKWKGKSAKDANIVQYYLTKRVEIPAREFIGISDKGVDQIQTAWVDHYWESMKKATRKRGGMVGD